MIKWTDLDNTYYIGFLHYAIDAPNEADVILIYGLVRLKGKWRWGWPIVY